MTDGPAEPGGGRDGSVVITDAKMGNSAEMSSRIRRYTITMAFRTACFLAMIFVHGPGRWVLFAGAVILPYIAVLFANQANKQSKPTKVRRVEPITRPQLTTGEPVEYVSGDVLDAEDERDRRVA